MFQSFAYQFIQHRQKGRQCFTAAGGRGDQSMPTFMNRGPGLLLCLGRNTKCLVKPGSDGGMKREVRHGNSIRLGLKCLPVGKGATSPLIPLRYEGGNAK